MVKTAQLEGKNFTFLLDERTRADLRYMADALSPLNPTAIIRLAIQEKAKEMRKAERKEIDG